MTKKTEAPEEAIEAEIKEEVTETAPAVVENIHVPDTPLSDEDSFLEDANTHEEAAMGIPELKIIHKGDHAGKLYCEDMQEEHETMTFAILKEAKSRILWPEKYSADNTPLCHSLDGITPAGDLKDKNEKPLKPLCDTCELLPDSTSKHKCSYANWGKGNAPPPCQESVDLLVMDMNSSMGYWVSFASTMLKPLRDELLKPLSLRKKALSHRRRKAGLSSAHSCMFCVTIKVVERKSDSGDSFIPEFFDLQELPAELHSPMVRAAMDVKDIAKRVEFEDREDEDDAPVDQDVPF